MMTWLRVFGLPLLTAATSSLENTRDKGKVMLYTCACQPVVSDPKRSCDFGSFDSGGRICSLLLLGARLLRYHSRSSKTNGVFSVIIDGGPGWLGHKRTYAINDFFQLNRCNAFAYKCMVHSVTRG